jgi:hypothetical protein
VSPWYKIAAQPGIETAASIEPSETYCYIATTRRNNNARAPDCYGAIARNTPNAVATPFSCLEAEPYREYVTSNGSHAGYGHYRWFRRCPKAIAQHKHSKALKRIKYQRSNAGTRPALRITFVAPVAPLPALRMSSLLFHLTIR